jgi:hypothetical protein
MDRIPLVSLEDVQRGKVHGVVRLGILCLRNLSQGHGGNFIRGTLADQYGYECLCEIWDEYRALAIAACYGLGSCFVNLEICSIKRKKPEFRPFIKVNNISEVEFLNMLDERIVQVNKVDNDEVESISSETVSSE